MAGDSAAPRSPSPWQQGHSLSHPLTATLQNPGQPPLTSHPLSSAQPCPPTRGRAGTAHGAPCTPSTPCAQLGVSPAAQLCRTPPMLLPCPETSRALQQLLGTPECHRAVPTNQGPSGAPGRAKSRCCGRSVPHQGRGRGAAGGTRDAVRTTLWSGLGDERCPGARPAAGAPGGHGGQPGGVLTGPGSPPCGTPSAGTQVTVMPGTPALALPPKDTATVLGAGNANTNPPWYRQGHAVPILGM